MKRITKALRGLIVWAALFPALASANGLLDALTSQLGVSPTQAAGGAGALLSSAKGTMGDSQYSELLGMSPSLSGLAEKAPSAASGETASGGSSWGSMVSGASAMMGGGSTADTAVSLANTFDSLGLTPDMVGKYSRVVLDYVQGEGGSGAASLLKGALPGF